MAIISMLAWSSVCIGQDARVPQPITASIFDAASLPAAMGSISRIPGKTLHVIVGHSVFVDTKTRLRRVYVADPTILTSVTLSPNQIIVTAMNPGLSSLTLLDETGQAQSYLVSADLDVEGLRTAMSEAMRGDAVKIEVTGGRVTLSGTVASEAMADSAMKLASLYSKEVSNALVVIPIHPKQVRLQVRILEVDRSKLLQLGINLFSPGGTSNFVASSTSSQFPTAVTVATGAAASTISASNPLSFLLYNSKLNLGATVQDLQTKQVLQILAEPTITTISGQKADFLSGGEFPFPVVQAASGAGAAPVISISFRPFGVKVEFTPIVNEDGTIRLKVAPEVSALDYSNAVSVSGITVPALSTRRAETEVELRSNQSFAISGLLDQRTTDILSKNPGAASIPILGYLFKAKNFNHSTTELVVVVTPTVVDPLSDSADPAQPQLPIAPLNTDGFDKSLGKNLNPQPAPPPTQPGPPYGLPLPATPPPVASPTPSPTGATLAPNAAPSSSQDLEKPALSTHSTPASTPNVGPVSAVLAEPGNQGRAGDPSESIRSGRKVEVAASTSKAMVEIMAVSHESDADVMVAALKRHGYDVAVNHVPQDSLLHLDVGPFSNKKDAETMRQRLLLDGYNATMK
jgi:pilus assembly protein CpaC